MPTAEYAHVSLDPEGVPVISGTRTKVVEVVVEHLAYYYDHKAEMDADIQRRLQKAEQIKADLDALQGEPRLIHKLRATGQLP